MAELTDLQINAIIRKTWLGATDISKLLSVSVSTVKNLWANGLLSYKVANNRQRTRKSSIEMVRAYQKRIMNPITWRK